VGYRAERALSALAEHPASVVIDDDYVMHREANAFLAALRARDRSVNTERVYAGRITLYLSYCSATGLDWKAPSVEELSRFRRALVSEPLPMRGRKATVPRYRSKGTANAVMTVVCELLRFGAAHQWVPPDVALALSEPKLLTHVPPGFDVGEHGQFRRKQTRTIKFAVARGGYKWLSDDQLTRLLPAPSNARDRFLIALMVVTGIRIGEALGLRREDMHFLARSDVLGCQQHGPHVHVRRRANVNGALAKSRYPRTVPVTDDVVGLYADYQHERTRFGAIASDMVFVNQFRPPVGRPMGYANAKDVFDRLSGQLGFVVRPHMLRHTAAERWRRQGVASDIRQRLLGHVSASSMEPYLHPTDEEKRAAVELARYHDGRQMTLSLATSNTAAAWALPEPEQTRWMAWLQDHLVADWRPGEWESERCLFTGDPDNPATVVSRCAVRACSALIAVRSGLCTSCRREHGGTHIALHEFTETHKPQRAMRTPGVLPPRCAVQRDGNSCGGEVVAQGLCDTHHAQWLRVHRHCRETDLEDWAENLAEPLAHSKPCLVTGCDFDCFRRGPLCFHHYSKRVREAPTSVLAQWAQSQTPFLHAHHFSLVPLQPLARLEVLYALQERDQHDLVLNPPLVRRLVKVLTAAPSVMTVCNGPLDQLPASSKSFRAFQRDVYGALLDAHGRMSGITTNAMRGPTAARRRRAGDAFAIRGVQGETISQAWLKMWISDWQRRTHPPIDRLREAVRAGHIASEALERRNNGGHDCTTLQFDDMDAIVKAMRTAAYPDATPYSYSYRRSLNGRFFEVIEFARKAGLMDDVPGSFARHRSHIIPCPSTTDDEPGRAIPESVIAQLDTHLDTIGGTFPYQGWHRDHVKLMVRTAYIVLRDTGRRPQEVCKLKVDCVDSDDGYTLIWDNFKARRLGRQLPILTSTAEAILRWREARSELAVHAAGAGYLFPGRRPLASRASEPHFTSDDLGTALREWVRSLDDLHSDAPGLDGKPLPFDRSRVFPYAFRHSYAQRHADAGVAVDVLKELMDHKSVDTTMGYYKVTLKRKRQAVDTMRQLVVDRGGSSTPATSSTAYELRAVAVPYGNCIEPANVKAGGHACPIRFQCSGCGFYRPDPSYLPAIDQHIISLKATREKAIALDTDDFVVPQPHRPDRSVRPRPHQDA
jgi:integrase